MVPAVLDSETPNLATGGGVEVGLRGTSGGFVVLGAPLAAPEHSWTTRDEPPIPCTVL